jgi:phage tail sheath gpL-like
MAVAFKTIPSNLRIPGVFNEFAEPVGIGGANLRALLIGQTINALPVGPQLAPSLDAVKALCGTGSILAQMMYEYRQNDPLGEVWILPLADAGGAVAATGTVAFTGPATAAGTLALYVDDVAVNVAVAAAQTATALGTAVAAAINALPNLPVTATAATGTVTLTAKNKGTLGNDIDIRMNYQGAAGGEMTPAGIAVTITPMASGATDPDLATALATLSSMPFDFIAMPYTGATDLGEMTAFMNNTTGRWSWSQMLFGHVFSAKRGAVAPATRATALTNLVTFSGAGAVNDAHLSVVPVYDSPTNIWKHAAGMTAFAAVAVRADNAPPPFQTGTIAGIKAPPPASRWSQSDQQTLLTNGLAPFNYAADGTVSILRAITTYQLDLEGQPDASYLDCETMFALAAFVRFIRQRLQTKFARCKLAADGTNFGAGSSSIVTPKIARAEILACFQNMIDLGWVQDIAGFSASLDVEIDGTDPTRLDMLIPANIIPGLHVMASQTQLNLGG